MERTVYLDPLEYVMKRYQSTVAEMPQLEGESILLWQESLRASLTSLMGGFPEKCELSPETIGHVDFEDYSREAIIYRSRENLDVFAYFLQPSAKVDKATIICLPGHGYGVDDIVGIREDETQRPYPSDESYQRDFALQCVKQGFNVLAIEMMGFGRRRHCDAVKEGPGAWSCNPVAPGLLLMNDTMIAHRVYDVIRGIDYLETRDDVDPANIACMGISGGGMTALFSAALDCRIKVAVVSGYLNTFKDSIMSIHHCVDNYIYGLLPYAEMYHVAGLVAPRPLWCESGTQDSIFPIQATCSSFEKVKSIYNALGAPDNLGLEVFEGEHQFYGVGAFEFLNRSL